MVTELGPPKPQKRLPLTEQAYRELRRRLISLEIRPGSPLNDITLLPDLGVGRTPLREALKRLETDHLVVTFPKRGTFAATVELTDLADIAEVREALEPLAAEKAAKQATAEARADMVDSANRLRGIDARSLSPREVMDLDKGVHLRIYAAAGNRHLETTLDRFDNLANRIWNVVLDRLPAADEDGLAEHVAILEAVAAGEAATAHDLMRAHVVEADARIRTVL